MTAAAMASPITLTQEQLQQLIAQQVAAATASLQTQLNAAKTGGKGACTSMAVIPAGKSPVDGKVYKNSALRIERVGLLGIMLQTPVVEYLCDHAADLVTARDAMRKADAAHAGK
jgi:hypothetical protein